MQFEVSSSDGTGVYVVRIEGRPGSIRMFCTCAAGDQGQHCKHRIELLDGEVKRVISGDISQLESLKQWLPGSSLSSALAERAEAERAVDLAKARLKKANSQVGRAMREG